MVSGLTALEQRSNKADTALMDVPDRPAAMGIASTMELPDFGQGWQPVGYAVLADGTLAVLTADVDLAGELQRIRAAFYTSTSSNPPSRLAEMCATGNALIWTVTAAGTWAAGPTFPLETPFPRFDRFGDGRWLVAASRSDGGADTRVLSPEGATLDRLTLGDGIEQLVIDDVDRIWVGWFDEGILGNDTWRVPGHDWPPSSHGVACFDGDGTLLPLPIRPTNAGAIDDCYALNAVGPGAWVCAFTQFPLVRLVPGEPARWWRSEIAGPTAVAIDGNHALLAGGYNEDANRLALVALGGKGNGEHASVLATWALPLRRLPPAANDWAPVWDRPSLLAGRGDTLHLVNDRVWYRWRIRDLIPS